MKRCLLFVGTAVLLAGCAGGWQGIARPAETVTYEDFGAKGDGKADDRLAIVAAHAAANERGLPVRAKDGATYYMGCGGETAIIRTDVDFGTAKFIIDDTKVKKRDIRSQCFVVAPDDKPIDITKQVNAAARSRGTEPAIQDVRPVVAKGQGELGVKLPGRCLVQLCDESVKHYIRKGANRNNGTAQNEVLLVDADGRVDPRTPVLWDYGKVTSAKAYPIGGRTLTVKGGVFTTIANQAESRYTYHMRGIAVNRSNVRVEGLKHLVTGELDHGAPYAGFICISLCADVTVTGCVFTARRTYMTIGNAGTPVSMGSYGISVNRSVNVSFVGCGQTTDILDRRYWGLFGSNYCRNLLFDGCEFSRFDAHQGVCNATIRNCRLGHMGVQAIGFGTLLIENSTVRSRGAFLGLRSDYGSTWDGDVIIRNCRFAPCNGVKDSMPPIINGSNDGTHDFGYACTMPHRIVIDGLEIDDSGREGEKGDTYLFGQFLRKADAKYPYALTEEVRLRNVRTASGRELKVSRSKALADKVRIIRE